LGLTPVGYEKQFWTEKIYHFCQKGKAFEMFWWKRKKRSGVVAKSGSYRGRGRKPKHHNLIKKPLRGGNGSKE